MKGSLYSNTINNPLLAQRKGQGSAQCRAIQRNQEKLGVKCGVETIRTTPLNGFSCFVLFFFHIINTNKFFQCLFFPLKKKMFAFCVSHEVGETQTKAFHGFSLLL